MYNLGRIIFTFYLYIFNSFHIHGKENQIPEGPYILFANHQSILDIFVLNIAIKRKLTFIAKKSVFDNPFIGFFAKSYGAFPVDREKTDITAIKNCLKTIKNGDILAIFPEGTRIRKGKIPSVKAGFVSIALKTNSDLLPVRIQYKRNLMIFNKIDVYIGKPLSIKDDITLSDNKPDLCKTAQNLMNICYGLGINENI